MKSICLVMALLVPSLSFASRHQYSLLETPLREAIEVQILQFLPEYDQKALTALQDIMKLAPAPLKQDDMLADLKLTDGRTVGDILANSSLTSVPEINLVAREGLTVGEYLGSLGNGMTIETILAGRTSSKTDEDRLRLSGQLDAFLTVGILNNRPDGTIDGEVQMIGMNFPYCTIQIDFSKQPTQVAYTTSAYESCD